jgi:hypothetical protein
VPTHEAEALRVADGVLEVEGDAGNNAPPHFVM